MERAQKGQDETGLNVADLAEALIFMKADAAKLLKDMLRGISMWGITAAMAFVMAAVWFALGELILRYAHPFGSPPFILDLLYASDLVAVASALLGAILSWRYYSLRKRYGRLYEIAENLR